MKENTVHNRESATERTALHDATDDAQPPAWEMIENGRYQPRRIKGSCLGRELG